MYARFLFVGLGGSGGKTLRFLKREILHWMEIHDAGHSIPAGWQFLHIDTPPTADGQEIDHLADPLPADEYLGLINQGVDLAAVQNMLDGNKSFHSELQTWRVDPSGMPVPLAMGAGQFRAVGQTVAMAYSSKITEKLEHAVSRMSMEQSQAEIGEVYSKVTGEAPAGESNMYIVVVSSLAGGTGAGLLNIVCDTLRAMDTDADQNIFGILYTPEVFNSIDATKTGGVQPNSLGAISEVLNGHWWGGAPITGQPNQVPPIVNPILVAAGLPIEIPRSGPAYPFLVGRVGSGGIDHGTPERLFEMAGRSLLSWVTDRIVQAKFIAYTAGNWSAAALGHTMGPILVDQGDESDKGYPCFSALGFARLSVGTEYFERYTVQRIVKDAIQHLVHYHHMSEEAKGVANKLQTNDPTEIANAIAEHHLLTFLHDSHLCELGAEDNEIIDALRPQNHQELYDNFRQRALDLSGFNDGSNLQISEWQQRIRDGIGQASSNYESNYQTALEESTIQWIRSVQDNVSRAVATATSRLGLKVAASLCKQATTRLRADTYNDLMNNDYERNNQWAQEWEIYAAQGLDGISGKVASNHAGLREAIATGQHSASFGGEALLAARAAELCKQVADKVLEPIEKALLDAHITAEGEYPKTATWVPWSDEEPPRSVTPPAGDFPLVNPDDYPQRFIELLEKTTNQTQSEAAREKVRLAVISGDFLEQNDDANSRELQKLNCVQVDFNWWPATTVALGGFQAPSELRVHIATTLKDLEGRMTRWLHRTGAPFATFLNLSLRSYLGTDALFDDAQLDAAEIRQNRSRFLTQMNAAVTASEPLINIDQTLMGLVHPDQHGRPKMHFSQIPLQGHPIESDLKANLVAAGVDDGVLVDLLTNDESVRHVDITTSLHAPHSILVIESLLKPIAATWNKTVQGGSRGAFWARRRAQRLQRFIPAPQALIVCMIRGWFTGLLLGRIDRSSGPTKIARHDKENAAEFPYPFLSPEVSGEDRLSLILEALGLAYVEAGRASTLTSLEAYIELRELGRSGPDAGLYTYHGLSKPLTSWIETGSFPEAIGNPWPGLKPASQESGSGPEGPPERAKRLLEVLNETRTTYEDRYRHEVSQWSNSASTLSGPPLWTGLWPLMALALSQLAESTQDHMLEMDRGGAVLG